MKNSFNIKDLINKMNTDTDDLYFADPVPDKADWGSSNGERVTYTLSPIDTKNIDNNTNIVSKQRIRRFESQPFVDSSGTLVIPKEYGVNRSTIFDPANGGAIINMYNLNIALPRYPLHRVHSFLMANPWHYACVQAKASAATELGYIWEPTGNRYKRRPRIQSQQAKMLMEFEDRIYVNSHKDLATVLKDISIDYFSCGNMFMEVAYTPLGKVNAVYSASATTCFKLANIPAVCQIIPKDMEGTLPILDSLWAASSSLAIVPLFKSAISTADIGNLLPADYKKVYKPDSKIVHEANYVISTDPFYGVSDILPSLSAILGDVAANDYNLQFFQHNAVPRYAVLLKGGKVSQQNKEEIVKFLNESVLQQHHRTIVIPLGRGMEAEFKALDVTPNEASFLKLKEMNRNEIIAVHRVPPSKVGMWENSNRSNGVQQDKDFFLEVTRPYQARVERMINRVIQDMGITEFRFKFKEVSWADEKAQADAQSVLANAANARITALKNMLDLVKSLKDQNALDEAKSDKLLSDIADKLDTAFEISLQYED